MHSVLVLMVLAYLLGSIPSGLLVARALGGPDGLAQPLQIQGKMPI